MPIVLSPLEKATLQNGKLVTDKVTVTATVPLILPRGENYRTYNQVGGFSYLPLEIHLKKGEEVTVKLK